MDVQEFEMIFDQQVDICRKILIDKAKEYADDADRLHNFKVAAALGSITEREALAGMMRKHTVSIYDMTRSPELYSLEMWNEKITDHINYLILLKAVVAEELRAHAEVQGCLPYESPEQAELRRSFQEKVRLNTNPIIG